MQKDDEENTNRSSQTLELDLSLSELKPHLDDCNDSLNLWEDSFKDDDCQEVLENLLESEEFYSAKDSQYLSNQDTSFVSIGESNNDILNRSLNEANQ